MSGRGGSKHQVNSPHAERGASHPAASLGPCRELTLLGERKVPAKTQDPNSEETLFRSAAAHRRDGFVLGLFFF